MFDYVGSFFPESGAILKPLWRPVRELLFDVIVLQAGNPFNGLTAPRSEL